MTILVMLKCKMRRA